MTAGTKVITGTDITTGLVTTGTSVITGTEAATGAGTDIPIGIIIRTTATKPGDSTKGRGAPAFFSIT
jgi:hypothetical protein